MRKSDVRITFDESSIKILIRKSEEILINWSEINYISVFKRDLIGFDEICMELETDDRKFEINEEFKGWDKFVRKLPEFLKGCEVYDDWFKKIIHPPFATNLIRIFTRKT